MLKPNATVFEPHPEQACEKVIYSGGGFSNYFDMPDYQKNAVQGWFQQNGAAYVNKYGSRWNSTGTVRGLNRALTHLGRLAFTHVYCRAAPTQISQQMGQIMLLRCVRTLRTHFPRVSLFIPWDLTGRWQIHIRIWHIRIDPRHWSNSDDGKRCPTSGKSATDWICQSFSKFSP